MPKQKVSERVAAQDEKLRGVKKTKSGKESYGWPGLVALLDSKNSILNLEMLDEEDVMNLIDGLFQNDQLQKGLDKRVTRGKEIIQEYAEKNKIRVLFGNEAEVKISDGESTSIKVKDAIKWLEKHGKLGLMETVLSVRIGEMREYFGNDIVSQIGETKTKPYNSVKLTTLK